MRRLISFTAFTAVTLTVALLCFAPAQAKKPTEPPDGGGNSTPYRLVDLGALEGGYLYQAEALDVNNPDGAGVMQVVGYSHRPVPDPSPGAQIADAVIWDVTDNGQILDLTDIAPGTPENTGGWRVNDFGYILVTDLLWVPGTGYVTLPGLGGGAGSAELMDDLGGVYGTALDADGIEHAIAWQVSPDGQVSDAVDLGDMDGFYWNDVNNHGVFAGRLDNGTPEAAIAWFDERGTLQIQSLGKLHPDSRAEAICLNDNGIVAGESSYGGITDGFVWTAETGMVSIGSLNGRGCDVRDINNQGQVVGWSWSGGRHGQVAFVWQNGQMFDLNEITDGGGGKNWIQIASGINDAGHIAALLHVNKPTSQNHGALLVPN